MSLSVKELWKRLDLIEFTDSCWLWKKPGPKGYAALHVGNDVEMVHRLAYRLWVGCIPSYGYEIHHTCEVRNCLYPEHLVLLTVAEHRRLHAKRQEFCKRGHEFSFENTVQNLNGKRQCRKCKNLKRAERRSRGLERR